MLTATPISAGLHGFQGISTVRERADQPASSALTFEQRRRAAESRTPEGKARAAAEDLVSVSLIEPTLKLLRESNNASAPFAPGEAEKAFGPLLDQAIAQRIVRASGFGIVDRLASDLLKHSDALRASGVNLHA